MRRARPCGRGTAQAYDSHSQAEAEAEATKEGPVKRPYPLMFFTCVMVAVGSAGCAARPSVKRPTVKLDVVAKQLGVSPSLLELALRAGYTTEIEGGKTLFCRHDEQTGSMIGTLQCEDAARLQSDLQARQQFVDDLRQRVPQTAIASRPGGGSP